MATEKLKKLVEISQSSIQQAFETMFPMSLDNGLVDYEEGTAHAQGKYEIVGIIGMTGENKGSISIHVNRTLGEKLAKLLLGMDTIEEEADIFDTIGEFANIVAGGTKTMAATDGIDFDITCPTIIRGDDTALVEPARGSHVAMVHFKADGCEEFVVMTALVE